MKCLLLHGFTGGPASFDGLIESLSAHAPANRPSPAPGEQELYLRPWITGHGPQADFSSHDFDAEVDRLASFVANERDVPVRLLGYSQGARLALGLLLKHPHLFCGADLIGVNPGLSDAASRDARIQWEVGLIAQLKNSGLEAFLEHWESLPIFSSQADAPRSTKKAQAQIRRSHSAQGLVQALLAIGLSKMPNYWPHLKELRCPVRLICGQKDLKFVEIAETMLPFLAQGRLEILPGVGHNPLVEAPELLASVVVSPPTSADSEP